jgi:hypothetical protein
MRLRACGVFAMGSDASLKMEIRTREAPDKGRALWKGAWKVKLQRWQRGQ